MIFGRTPEHREEESSVNDSFRAAALSTLRSARLAFSLLGAFGLQRLAAARVFRYGIRIPPMRFGFAMVTNGPLLAA